MRSTPARRSRSSYYWSVGHSVTIEWVFVSSHMRLWDHTQRRTTVSRTPLNEWSVCRRDLYLTTHNNHNRQTSMPPRRAEDFYLPLKKSDGFGRVWTHELGYQRPAPPKPLAVSWDNVSCSDIVGSTRYRTVRKIWENALWTADWSSFRTNHEGYEEVSKIYTYLCT